MIKQLNLWRFKRWKNKTIELHPDGLTLFVGGNNAGKSSVLQALALWGFCKTVLENEKGPGVFYGEHHQGVGLGADDFTAVPVPSLKHLWTNLRPAKEGEPDGYTLKVGAVWNAATGEERRLEFGLALANERLFVKVTATTVPENEKIPTVAYLPPFGGLVDKETRLSAAQRRRLLGLGQSGAILRNVLLDYHQDNLEKRRQLKASASKISNTALRELRATDAWELVISAIRKLFLQDLRVHSFNPAYHTSIRVECCKGSFTSGRFKKHPKYNYRDLMVEGAGFLQWLGVFTLAVNPGIDVLLLDEPDAHLHCSLQLDLIKRLIEINVGSRKQLLVATHSTELIRNLPAERIAKMSGNSVSYLKADSQKVGLLAGIGAEYSPRLHRLQHSKRLLLVESDLDARLLEIWSKALNHTWPSEAELVVWPWPSGHAERKQLFLQMKAEIPDLEALSLRDKDDESLSTTTKSLLDKMHANGPDGLACLKWRRREIENYLLWPAAIAKAANASEGEVVEFFANQHALVIPEAAKFTSSDCASALCEVDGKALMSEGEHSVQARFGCTREQVCSEMSSAAIPQDVKTALSRIVGLTATT